MASESREEQSVSVDLSDELDEWLDQQAERTDTDRAEVVRQLLQTYHATETLDETAVEEIQATVEETVASEATKATRAAVADRLQSELPERVETEVGEQVERAVESTVEDRLADAIETAVSDRLPGIVDAVESRLDERLSGATDEVEAEVERLDADFREKLDDVRQRVVQVKKETDAKAPADHTHEAFERFDELDGEIETLETDLGGVREDLEDLDGRVDDTDERLDDVVERLDDAEDKLKRVAWVVSDLRDETQGKDSHERAVARIKRAAAQEGLTTARCENCSESVEIALLTDPECPHCHAAVSDVRPEGGIFRTKARLVTASELEAGEET
ncbi:MULTISPECIES: ribbon-helix-helix protein, CopG family [Halomicrobium]|uniref:CopG domain protein DNA-binding domain protein n=2 Tax=Halomicrobium mukohataei TaxID=57705 RepID=C7P2Z9_HALMD|nr:MULTISPECIES: ribbon-helix-helix protein, CopG family [Halomicrobium]ACV47471.1 CopG domain protein DNA-binding domain protein [Halomicrobium mukohataei DSM 12286]QCD65935.1 ribbon-helix-helix protein, CopG family [Halomicrobium mukohataei]QFR20740.1 ribbon-helix-helix protein, CopG family [Halomicrobium sp. ZPS1]